MRQKQESPLDYLDCLDSGLLQALRRVTNVPSKVTPQQEAQLKELMEHLKKAHSLVRDMQMDIHIEYWRSK